MSSKILHAQILAEASSQDPKTTMLTSLSDELLISIAQYVGAITYEPGAMREDYPEPGHILNLALCNRRFHAICEPILYTNYCQQGKGCNRSLASFLEVILARPDLAARVKTICVASDFTGDLVGQSSVTDWESMVMSVIVVIPNLEAVYFRGWTTIWSSMFGNPKKEFYNILPEVSACQISELPPNLKKIVWEWQSDDKEDDVNLVLRKRAIRSSMRNLGKTQCNFLTVDSFSCIPSRKLHHSCLVMQGDELRRETLAMSGTTHFTYHRPSNTADLLCGNLPPLKRFHQRDHLLHNELSAVPFHLTSDLRKSKSTLEHLEILDTIWLPDPFTSPSSVSYFVNLKSLDISAFSLLLDFSPEMHSQRRNQSNNSRHNRDLNRIDDSSVVKRKLEGQLPPTLEKLTLRNCGPCGGFDIVSNIWEMVEKKQQFVPRLRSLNLEWMQSVDGSIKSHPGFTSGEAKELLLMCKDAGLQMVIDVEVGDQTSVENFTM